MLLDIASPIFFSLPILPAAHHLHFGHFQEELLTVGHILLEQHLCLGLLHIFYALEQVRLLGFHGLLLSVRHGILHSTRGLSEKCGLVAIQSQLGSLAGELSHSFELQANGAHWFPFCILLDAGQGGELVHGLTPLEAILVDSRLQVLLGHAPLRTMTVRHTYLTIHFI